MPIKKFSSTHIWANAGTKTEPSSTKKDLGFVSGEQPSCDQFNWLENETEIIVNGLVNERLISYPEDIVDPYEMISSNLWSSGNYGQSLNNQMYINGGAAKAYVDIAICYDDDGNPMVLALNQANTTIEKWNARTLTNVSVSSNLAVNLPSGTWKAESMCCDNSYIYVVFRDTAGHVYRLQSWRCDTFGVNSSWPTTGCALPGSGTPPGTKSGKVIVASATKLATMNGWVESASSASTLISIVSKSVGTITASGAGDAPSGVYAVDTMVSDGTNVYYYATGTTPYCICTATIADPTAGTSGTGYPKNAYGGACILGSAGTAIVSAVSSGAYGATDAAVKTHRADFADCDTILTGRNAAASALAGSNYIYNKAYALCFDGINIWVAMKSNGQKAAVALLKIDMSKLLLDNRACDNQRSIPDLTNSHFLLGQDTNLTVTYFEYVNLIFDGRDLWCNVQPSASTTDSGMIYRLPLALLRN